VELPDRILSGAFESAGAADISADKAADACGQRYQSQLVTFTGLAMGVWINRLPCEIALLVP